MVVVVDLLDALPQPRGDMEDAVRAKAGGPGRMRDTALRLIDGAFQRPFHASSVIRQGLREARYLHSRERRLVGDGIYALLRSHRLLRATLGDDRVGWWRWWLGLLEVDFSSALVGEWIADLAMVASVPVPVAEQLNEAFGEVGAKAFVKASNRRAAVVVRANRARTNRDSLASRLAADGIETTPCRLAPDGLEIRGRANLLGTRVYRDGLFEVQSEGSQLIGDLVEPEGVVLDFCAGAGGKALALAATGRCRRLVAHDVRGAALDELGRRARRVGAKIKIGEPVHADRVLVDAPCSGSGTLRRHAERRLRWFEEGCLENLYEDQAAILDRASTFVRAGGRLIYATCSVLPTENELVIERFLKRNAEFIPRMITGPFGTVPELRLSPQKDGTDGFFAAVLERRRP